MSKLLASSPTKDGIEKLINQYFYSTGYKINEQNIIIGKNGILKGYKIEVKKNRFRFIEEED